MSDQDNDLQVPNELASLKSRADMLGLKYHPSISAEKLKEKINAVLAGEPEPAAEVSTGPVAETVAQQRYRLKREANELVRIRVTCMNPAKTEWEGELFTAGNSVVGSFTKFVPFNAPNGWHVPNIIYKMIRDRECQVFTAVRDSRGNTSRTGKIIKEFAIEVMPNLTAEELKDLANQQAMAKTVD